MAVHDLLAGVADRLLREAVSDDLGAPLPSAPPLLPRHTHGGCDWFTGICSVPDRVTWLATETDRTASCGRGRRAARASASRPAQPSAGPGAGAGKVRRRHGKKVSPPGGPAHRGGSGAAGPWADAAWDEAVLKAPRNWLRKASIGSSGAEWPGSSPSCQCQEAICRNTEGSRATIEIGTSWLARSPLTVLEGWWSPSRMSTRFGSLSSVTHEVRARSEYWIDRP